MPLTQRSRATSLKKLAAIILLSSELEDEELLALGLLFKALNVQNSTLLRGSYDAVHSNDFLWKLIHEFSNRNFKAFLR